MLFKALAVFLTIGSVLALTPLESRIQAESMLLDIMMTPRDVDPVVQQYCFNRYIPLLKEINDKFQTDYLACQSAYDKNVKLIDADYVKQRENATAVAEESCQALQKCDSIVSYTDAFDCFGVVGQEQSNSLSVMAGRATLSAVEIRERYATMASTRDQCFVVATNTYNDQHSATNTELQNCLNGDIIPEVTEAPTTNPPPPSSTTDE